MTNYERIKGMSVEEIAELLEILDCCIISVEKYNKGIRCHYEGETCKGCLKEWLEKEADDDKL